MTIPVEEMTPDQATETLLDLCAQETPRMMSPDFMPAYAEKLIACGADVNAMRGGETVLALTAQNDYGRVTRVLLSASAKIDARNDDGATPLLRAIACHTYHVAHILFGQGADVNISNDVGISPLHSAASDSDWTMCHHLLGKGARIEARDWNGKTPLYIAAWQRRLSTCRYLIRQGADANAKAYDGSAPIHAVLDKIDLPVARALLIGGADPLAPNQHGVTAAAQKGIAKRIAEMETQVETLLQNHGPMSRRDAYFEIKKGREMLIPAVTRACVTRRFYDLVAMPLITSGRPEQEALFEEIYAALSSHWKEKNTQALVELKRIRDERQRGILLAAAGEGGGPHEARLRRKRGERKGPGERGVS